jgi:Cu(I)/Ag(I) efflux system membrane fusion protein/cobalt-zinc-cadmium efflux system membrane fusion protein
MYGHVTLRIEMGEQIVIPTAGVLRTGTRNIVFIDRGAGYLVPSEVELGPRVGDDLIILKGLEAGQKIVASANFLIDSESQLQAAAGSFAPPPAGVSRNTAQPSEAKSMAALEIITIPNPPVRGKNRIRAALKDLQGRGIDGAKVSVTFFMAAMPAMGMVAMRATATLTDQGAGAYTGDLSLESGGTWQVTAVATKDGQVIVNKQFNLSATGGM